MNESCKLRPSLVERRPEGRVRHVGQRILGGSRDLGQGIDRLRAIAVTEEVLTGVIQVGALLQVVRPIGHAYRGAAGLVGFDRVLVHGRINQPEIVDNTAGLTAFTGTEKSRHRNRRQERDDRHDDHDFHEGETPATLFQLL